MMPASCPHAEISPPAVSGGRHCWHILFGALYSYLQRSRVIRSVSHRRAALPCRYMWAVRQVRWTGSKVCSSWCFASRVCARFPGRKCQHCGSALHILCWPALSHPDKPPNTVLCWLVLRCGFEVAALWRAADTRAQAFPRSRSELLFQLTAASCCRFFFFCLVFL